MWLNSRDIKKISAMIEKQWGSRPDFGDYNLTQNSDDRVYIVNKGVDLLETEGFRVNSIGLYFGRLAHGEIKLSIEGSQIVGPIASKNVLKLSDAQFEQWLQGLDITFPGESKGFLLICHNHDFFGCSRHTNGKLLNLVPKERRIRLLTSEFTED